jgi:hypothetical protein
MNLVNELQLSAERDEVLTVLRKARRLASKLGVNDIDHWLKAEQDGYAEGDDVPSYRTVKGTLVFQTNGPVPVGLGRLANGIMNFPGGFTVDRLMVDPLGEVMAMIDAVEKTGNGLFMQMEDNGNLDAFRRQLNAYIARQATFLLQINTSQVRAIPEAVKDKVLDWACELERRGVHGENMTFDENEKRLAHQITFNINNSREGDQHVGDKINVRGNVIGSAVGSRASLMARDIVTQIQQSGLLGEDIQKAFAAAADALGALKAPEGTKEDVADDLAKLKKEMEKPTKDEGRIKTIWERINSVASTVATALSAAASIGKIVFGGA